MDASPPPPIDPLDHQQLVKFIADQYMGRGLEFDDLFGEGQIGLVIACKKFDPSMGVEFSTYAVPWIKSTIRLAVSRAIRPVSVPRRVYRDVAWLDKGRLSPEDLTIHAQECVRDARKILGARFTNDEMTLGSCLSPDGGGSGGEPGGDSGDAPAVSRYLGVLRSRERALVEARFGLGRYAGEGGMTFDEIGRRFHINRSRAGMLFNNAMRKIRVRADVDMGSGLPERGSTEDGSPARRPAQCSPPPPPPQPHPHLTSRPRLASGTNSPFRGVHLTPSGRWIVRVVCKRLKVNRGGGTFDTAEQARDRANQLGRDLLGIEGYARPRDGTESTTP